MSARRSVSALLLLLAGAMLALAIERVALHHRAAPVSPELAMHNALMAQLDSAVELKPGQRDSIEQIFRRHQAMVDSAWTTINTHMHATMDSVRVEIEGILDAHQIAPFRNWIERHHSPRPMHQRH